MFLRVCESLRPEKICLVCTTAYATTSRDNWIRSRIAHAMPQNLRETYLSRLSMAIPTDHHLRVNYACRLSGMTTSAPKQTDDDARLNPSMYYLVIAPTEI